MANSLADFIRSKTSDRSAPALAAQANAIPVINSVRISSPLKTGSAETKKALDQTNGQGPENSSTVPNFLLLKSTPAKTVGAQWGKSQTNLAAKQHELTQPELDKTKEQNTFTKKPNHLISDSGKIGAHLQHLHINFAAKQREQNTAGVSQNKEPNTFNKTQGHLTRSITPAAIDAHGAHLS